MEGPAPLIMKVETQQKFICCNDLQSGIFAPHRYATIAVLDADNPTTYYCHDCACRDKVVGSLVILMGITWP